MLDLKIFYNKELLHCKKVKSTTQSRQDSKSQRDSALFYGKIFKSFLIFFASLRLRVKYLVFAVGSRNLYTPNFFRKYT